MLKRWITRIHLWAGLLLGFQVVIWMASGVIMSWFHIDEVRGTTRSATVVPEALSLGDVSVDLRKVSEIYSPRSLRITMFRGEPVIQIEKDGEPFLLDLEGQEQIEIDEAIAMSIALEDYLGDAAKPLALMIKKDPPLEYGGPLPVWQVSLNDIHGTRIYISAESGRITARRNHVWRLYDFFWMLHIMDYEERHDFNNPLIRVASLTGLIFALSGLGLVIIRLRSGRYLNDLRRIGKPR